ncbi:bile acid:sodium symporter family protein [Pontibacter sp. G13]|uniref:bile acid:sodium symporter family protein n=1 Tax=Pontibacter sp. G13 TaxID=3074898 RepID=UPI0028897F59|nr:bile acid:sodium symporter family protein [Pontibacter sp. G13]WNJ21604.1 bile acid:sodium symporter family protein [Pontibacter sp. G13]
MKRIQQLGLLLSPVALLAAGALFLWTDWTLAAGILLVSGLVALSIGAQLHPKTKGFSFTITIFAAVAASLIWPAPFVSIGGFPLKKLIVPLLQVIMFGMGTTMSLQDFAGVARMPKGVLVGVLCQFTLMPLIGVGLAKVAGFPPEIAAGIILVGASPSGLASNVMAYLARANVALSVTLTAVATLLAPLMTPLWMRYLAGEYIPVDFWAMMESIFRMVILPVAVGLLLNRLLRDRAEWLRKLMPLVSMAAIALIIAVITGNGRDNLLEIGLLLMVACLVHNLLGYGLGYGICRLLGMPEADCRTISLEVGMQNSGLASGIAIEMGRIATLGLAPAVFGPMMNITGSTLATWWRGKNTAPELQEEAQRDA